MREIGDNFTLLFIILLYIEVSRIIVKAERNVWSKLVRHNTPLSFQLRKLDTRSIILLTLTRMIATLYFWRQINWNFTWNRIIERVTQVSIYIVSLILMLLTLVAFIYKL